MVFYHFQSNMFSNVPSLLLFATLSEFPTPTMRPPQIFLLPSFMFSFTSTNPPFSYESNSYRQAHSLGDGQLVARKKINNECLHSRGIWKISKSFCEICEIFRFYMVSYDFVNSQKRKELRKLCSGFAELNMGSGLTCLYTSYFIGNRMSHDYYWKLFLFLFFSSFLISILTTYLRENGFLNNSFH